ncbi:MAG: PG0541 family transporter-associated protein [Fusobacteriaceae bacterium]
MELNTMKNRFDENGDYAKNYIDAGFKQVSIFVNENQKNRLVDFLDSIKFYGYAIVKDVETSWEGSKRHRKSHAWPGADCIFFMTVHHEIVDSMIKELKRYRMTLPENIIFAISISPIDKIIPDLYRAEV